MRTGKNESIVVSALSARTGFGKLLRRVEDEHRSLVIAKRGTPKAVLLSIRDYVRLAAPEPEVLRVMGGDMAGICDEASRPACCSLAGASACSCL
jgi:prevent-host-death family protein